MNGKILVIGSSNTDMVINSDRLPSPGETVIGGKLEIFAGGKGANQAVAAARSGGDVTFFSAVGEDSFGSQALENLKNRRMGIRELNSFQKNSPHPMILAQSSRVGSEPPFCPKKRFSRFSPSIR